MKFKRGEYITVVVNKDAINDIYARCYKGYHGMVINHFKDYII